MAEFAQIITLVNGNLDNSNLASGSVGTDELASLAVTNAKLADATIQPAKLAGGIAFTKMETLSSDRVLITNSVGSVEASSITTQELDTLDGVSSSIQTQLDGKQSTITGAATTIDDTDLTASRILASDANGKVAVSSITTTSLSNVVSKALLNETGSVDGYNLKADIVDGSKIADDSVDTEHLKDDAVTPDKTSFLPQMLSGSEGIFIGKVTSSGSGSVLPTGWSSSKTATGRYKITAPMTAGTYVCIVSPLYAAALASSVTPNTTGIEVYISDLNGDAKDAAFSFIAIAL